MKHYYRTQKSSLPKFRIFIAAVLFSVIGLTVHLVSNSLNSSYSSSAYAAVTGASKHAVAVVQSTFKGINLWGDVDIEGLPEPLPLDAELKGTHIDAMVRRAVELATLDEGGVGVIFNADDWICIKVNLVCIHGYSPEDGADQVIWTPGKTTDLLIVKSFMEMLAEEGVGNRISLVEGAALWKPKEMAPEKGFDGWSTKWGGYYENLSYDDVLGDLSERYPEVTFDKVDLNFDETVEMEVPGGSASKRHPHMKYHVPVTILNCDKLVDISNMKTHSSSRVTLSMKNYIGIAPGKIYGFPKALLHKNTVVDEAIVDLFSFHPAELAIIGGIIGVEGKGPQWGDDIRRNVIIAGIDPVAVDAVGTTLMGFNPWDIEYLHLAAEKGFGTLDMDSIEVRGNSLEDAVHPFKKPPYGRPGFYYGRGIRNWLINGFHPDADLDDMPLEYEPDLYPDPGDEEGGKIWEEYLSANDYVDLKKYFEYKATNGVCYAYTQFLSSVQEGGFLWIDGEKGLKIYLNGEEVYSNDSIGPYSLVRDKVPISVTRGFNQLLVKAKSTVGDFGFRIQIVDSKNEGDTMQGLKFFE